MPLGGIGTGTVSLGGRGDLRDWEIGGRPAKGFTPMGQGIYPFFAVYAKEEKGKVFACLLEGPVETSEYEGYLGSIARNHGFPRFREATFEAAYPFGQVRLSDSDMPVQATLKAFNPLIPGDVPSSSYPAAIVRIALENKTSSDLDTSVCVALPNFIGEDGSRMKRDYEGEMQYVGAVGNENHLREGAGLTGVWMTAPKLPEDSEQKGNIYIATPSGQDLTYRTAWADLSWGDTKLNFWDDFTQDGRLEEHASKTDKPVASLCIANKLAPGETREVTFLLTWHFPNRKTWSQIPEGETGIIGNHYTTRFKDSMDAAGQLFKSLPELERKTVAFVDTVCASTLPETVKQAALFNLSTLRTQTCFRTPDGKFFGWEGCCNHEGSCPGNCNHVWNYEHATAFLFGELSRTMRDIEFQDATDERGHMVFRVDLPLGVPAINPRCKNVAAADGQMGCIMKLYRDWQLSGDDAWLRDLYPQAKRALEFCWVEGGWDADRDGLMEGCQHNTMDVEYYGPNPQMGFWYLGALLAMREMARHVGDAEFAEECHRLYEAGSKVIDERLFNGEYYEQIVEPPKDPEGIAAGLRLDMGSTDLVDPDLQLGSGCLVDQLVGQYTAHILGLGHLSDPEKQRKTLASTFKYNFKQGFHDHFNHFRSFVLGDESGVLMATYPKGRRPERPFPYFNEVLTGFEYTLAVHLLYEGLVDEGLTIIRAIRERFDGKKRNPFDEAECGHHYARAMAAWSALLALTGFHYSGVDNRMTFKGVNGAFFWSNGEAWGRCVIDGAQVELEVIHGWVELKSFHLSGVGTMEWENIQRVTEKDGLRFEVPDSN